MNIYFKELKLFGLEFPVRIFANKIHEFPFNDLISTITATCGNSFMQRYV